MKKFLALILLCMTTVCMLTGCEEEVDHNDGKCDTCGKAMYTKIGDNELCYTHYRKFMNWYYENY